jgi:thermolabile hemolysin
MAMPALIGLSEHLMPHLKFIYENLKFFCTLLLFGYRLLLLLMKRIFGIVVSFVLLGAFALPAQAFTSLYIFGDGISTTTNNVAAAQDPEYYYGLRESNGRVWVEVLAQRLGLGANSMTNVNWSNASNDSSYYGQYSPNLLANLKNFNPPPDVKTSLFVVWVNCADFVNDMGTIYFSTQSGDTDPGTWGTAITNSINNHWNIINALYNKGVRTLVMPNAVDITEIPEYDNIIVNAPANRNFIRNEIISYNTQFAAMLNQARALGMTIYEPDFFDLLDNAITNASAYGLTNALSGTVSIDAYEDQNIPNLTIDGQGTNYIFWDPTDPTAQLHEIMADEALQLIAPAQIKGISILGNVSGPTVNQLVLTNLPVGLNGFLDLSTNMGAAWAPLMNLTSTGTQQTFTFNAPAYPPFVTPSGNGSINPGGGSSQNSSTSSSNGTNGIMPWYRLRFPLNWNWP